MKVILLSDVKKVGKKDQVVDVSDGYANNYLIKNKLAVLYTKKSKEVLDEQVSERNILEQQKIKELNEIKKALENKMFNFKVKTGKEDKVFGKVSSKQIQDELKSKGFNIDKKCIKLNNDLDTIYLIKLAQLLNIDLKYLTKDLIFKPSYELIPKDILNLFEKEITEETELPEILEAYKVNE